MPICSLKELANALGGEVSGDQVIAPGPGHSPKDRSLSVKLDDKSPEGFVVFSFAGDDEIECRDYVREKARLPPWKPNGGGKHNSSGKPNSHGASKKKEPLGKIVLLFDFTDKDGTVLYHEVRFDPKTFRIRRAKNGNWHSARSEVWKDWDWTKGDRDVPYRLPEVIAELAQGRVMAIVEGAGKADALRKLGAPATANANGACNTKGWKDGGELRSYFHGADIVISPDNDDPGFKFLDDVAAGLTGIAKRIRVVMLPGVEQKGDVKDWIKNGGTLEQWNELVANAPEWVRRVPDETVVDEEAKAAAAAREKQLIDELSELNQFEYDRRRRDAARDLHIRPATLDNARNARRAERAAERGPAPLFGHWETEPWDKVVDGDDLIKRIIARIRRHVHLRENQAITCAFFIRS
jgi:hypothetical protein